MGIPNTVEIRAATDSNPVIIQAWVIAAVTRTIHVILIATPASPSILQAGEHVSLLLTCHSALRYIVKFVKSLLHGPRGFHVDEASDIVEMPTMSVARKKLVVGDADGSIGWNRGHGRRWG